MDKKAQGLRSTPVSKSNQDPSKAVFECQSKRNGVQYTRKRENDKIEYKKSSNRSGRAGQRHVRPREKMDSQVEAKIPEAEFGSLQKCGSKKQNITHLLNWWGPGPERHSRHSGRDFKYGCRSKKPNTYCVKYNKEHYLHANCQLVVSSDHDYTLYEKDPDHLVDWELVEEVRLHMTESPSCPICLYPPIAAKVTRCGHIFCFSCVLHYLALTDENWRKCPICFDIVTLEDLKSVTYILHKEYSPDQEIELKLMRRYKESLVPTPITFCASSSMPCPSLSNPDERLSYAKFIKASKHEVSKFIVEREIASLECQLAVEGSEPEACFVEEALTIASQRNSQLKLESKRCSPMKNNSMYADCLLPSNSDNIFCSNFENISASSEENSHLEYQAYSDSREQGTKNMDKKTKSSLNDLHVDQLKSVQCSEEMGSGNLVFLDHESTCESVVANTTGAVRDSGVHTNPIMVTKGVSKSTCYFYQESSGAQIYLHALNVHMLEKEYGSLQNCPQTIKAKVLEKESYSVTLSLRQRLGYLRHLPLSCPFEMVEIKIQPPLVSQLTFTEFQSQLEQREKKRKKRAKEEYRIEKRVQLQEDKLMGRGKGIKINTTSFQHFPSFTEDLPLNFIDDQVPLPRSVDSTEEFPNLAPSFAQMIQCGHKKNEVINQNPLPIINEPCNSKQNLSSDEEFEEGERVPDYSTAFSDDFARVLEQATEKLSLKKTSSDENSQKGKKKRRNKGIVLLSSGGR